MDGGAATAIHIGPWRRDDGVEVAAAKARKRAKKHRSYTVAEVARLYGVHRNTVRHWMKNGLSVVRVGGLVLILGEELERFHNDRKAARRCPCPPGTIYCVKCREPRAPNRASLGQAFANDRTAVVTGTCSACGTGLNRRTRLADLQLWMLPVETADPAAASASSAPSR